jgi:hypothetical protein
MVPHCSLQILPEAIDAIPYGRIVYEFTARLLAGCFVPFFDFLDFLESKDMDSREGRGGGTACYDPGAFHGLETALRPPLTSLRTIAAQT